MKDALRRTGTQILELDSTGVAFLLVIIPIVIGRLINVYLQDSGI